MPPIERVLTYFTAVWGMMTNRPRAVDNLDVSADGFWESFWAIVVAMPPTFVGWAAYAKLIQPDTGLSRVTLFLAAGTIDVIAWLVPLAGFVLVARKVGLGDRMVHYVVAANWGGALLAWLMWPPQLLRLLSDNLGTTIGSMEVFLFLASLVLTWRLTNAALGKGINVATAVFLAMFVASLLVLFTVQDVLLAVII